MGLTFVDDGPWTGLWPVNHGPLNKAMFDEDIWYLWSSIQAISDHLSSDIVSLADIEFLSGSSNQLLFTLTDSSTRGPFIIPVPKPGVVGDFIPTFSYVPFDFVSDSGDVYIVLQPHISAATFDPGATDGHGHNLYGLWFSMPGDVLRDVLIGSPHDVGDILVWDGTHWVNEPPKVIASPVQTISASSWTPAITDANTYKRFTALSPGCHITIPENSSVAFDIGTEISGRQTPGAGAVEIEALSGSAVVFNPQDGCDNITNGHGSTFTIKKVATDEWDIWGRLKPT